MSRHRGIASRWAGAGAVGTGPQWMVAAVCAEVDPELFYPQRGQSSRGAKRVCARCPVQPQCLAYALANDERYGVWGGLSEPERRTRTGATVTQSPDRDAADQVDEVDEVVVARLIDGHPVAGATRAELAQAAFGLHRSGLGAPRIAARLGVGERQVWRWLARSRTGTPSQSPVTGARTRPRTPGGRGMSVVPTRGHTTGGQDTAPAPRRPARVQTSTCVSGTWDECAGER